MLPRVLSIVRAQDARRPVIARDQGVRGSAEGPPGEEKKGQGRPHHAVPCSVPEIASILIRKVVVLLL